MSVFFTDKLNHLIDFPKGTHQLGVVERSSPPIDKKFFEKLMEKPFEISGKVRKIYALEDIQDLLQQKMPLDTQKHPFYLEWINDMAEVSKMFCDIQDTDTITFWLGSKRGCYRYHVDNVAMRLLVTYAGKGTEWLPDEAADRDAFVNGESNEKIVKDKSALQFINQWDVSIFRGGPQGLLHRTPDDALKGFSILMRLDHPCFWDTIMKYQQEIV